MPEPDKEPDEWRYKANRRDRRTVVGKDGIRRRRKLGREYRIDRIYQPIRKTKVIRPEPEDENG